jgi:ribosome maturation factor RimP
MDRKVGRGAHFFHFWGRRNVAEANTKQKVEEKAQELCEPLIAAEGLELLDLEFIREHGGWILRLFIDKPGGTVGVEECALASHAVDKVLDIEDFIPHEYSLEVSSPGLNRPLKKAAHFESVRGKQVRIKTFAPLFEPPRKNFLGTLRQVSPDAVTVEVEGAGPFTINLKDIARANLEFQP